MPTQTTDRHRDRQVDRHTVNKHSREAADLQSSALSRRSVSTALAHYDDKTIKRRCSCCCCCCCCWGTVRAISLFLVFSISLSYLSAVYSPISAFRQSGQTASHWRHHQHQRRRRQQQQRCSAAPGELFHTQNGFVGQRKSGAIATLAATQQAMASAYVHNCITESTAAVSTRCVSVAAACQRQGKPTVKLKAAGCTTIAYQSFSNCFAGCFFSVVVSQ